MSALTLYGTPGKMTRRLAGVVIGTQGLAVFLGALVARALSAAEGSPTSSTFLIIGSVLALLCVLDAGLLGRPWGITLGWVLQIVTLACSFIVPMMLFVELLFGTLWLTALVQGHTMDENIRRVDAQWYAAQEASAQEDSAKEASGHEASEQETSGPETSPQETSAQDG
jgi:hypothetical protein